jgi:hypothetical protein
MTVAVVMIAVGVVESVAVIVVVTAVATDHNVLAKAALLKKACSATVSK